MIGLGTQEKRNFFLKFKTEAVEKKYFILKTRDTSEFKKETLWYRFQNVQGHPDSPVKMQLGPWDSPEPGPDIPHFLTRQGYEISHLKAYLPV